MSDKETIPTWFYNEAGGELRDHPVGAPTPDGYWDHPVKVPGSDAQKRYIADAEREGAPTPLLDDVKALPTPKKKESK